MDTIVCDKCSKEFQNQDGLSQHMQAKHTPQPPPIKEKSKLPKKAITITLLVFIILGVSFAGFSINAKKTSGQYDEFAKCLTINDVKMFGAYWCPHCESQKDMFGDSFKNVDYVECSLPNRAGVTQICRQEGIQSYPTWEFSGGERVNGVMSLNDLAARSGCDVNQQAAISDAEDLVLGGTSDAE
jgi:hypothetical protein